MVVLWNHKGIVTALCQVSRIVTVQRQCIGNTGSTTGGSRRVYHLLHDNVALGNLPARLWLHGDGHQPSSAISRSDISYGHFSRIVGGEFLLDNITFNLRCSNLLCPCCMDGSHQQGRHEQAESYAISHILSVFFFILFHNDLTTVTDVEALGQLAVGWPTMGDEATTKVIDRRIIRRGHVRRHVSNTRGAVS